MERNIKVGESGKTHTVEQGYLWTRIIPLLFILYIIGYINRGNISFAFSGIESQLYLTTDVLGMASGLFFVGYVGFQLPSIFLSSKNRSALIMALLPAFWSIFSIGNGFVHDSTELYLMQFLVGLSEGGFFPLAIIYISQHFPEGTRARATSLFMMAVPISIVVSSPISMSLISAFGWRMMFVIEGIPGLIFAPIMYFILDRTSRIENGTRTDTDSDSTGNWTSFIHVLKEVATNPAVLLLSALWFLWLTGLFSIMNWIPYILETTTGKSLTLLGFIISGIWIISPFVMYLVSHSSDRMKKRTGFIEIQLIVALIGSIILIFSGSSLNVMLAAFVLLATGMVGGMSIFWLLPSVFVKKTHSAVAVAFVNTLGNLGGFTGPYLFGYLRYVSGSFQSGYYAISIVLAATVLITYSLRFFRSTRNAGIANLESS